LERGVPAIPRDYLWLSTLTAVAQAAAPLGDSRRAEMLYETLLPHANEVASSQTTWTGPIAHVLGLLAETRGDHRSADSHMDAALAMLVDVGAPGVRTRLEWARFLLGRGDLGARESALTLLVAAAEEAARLGADALASWERQLRTAAYAP
jgi:hypothetical protein